MTTTTISSSKKGVLYRQSKNSGVWQKRYCSITGSFLTLYKSSEYTSQSLVAMVDLAQVEEVFISDKANPSFPHTPTPLPESPNSLETNHYIVLQMKSKNLLKSDPKSVGGISPALSVGTPSSDENVHPQKEATKNGNSSPPSPQPQIFTLRAESYSQASYWVGLLSYVKGRAKGGKKSAMPFGRRASKGAIVSSRPSSALSKISEVGEGEGADESSVNISTDFDPYLSLNSSFCLEETPQQPSSNPTPSQPTNLSYSDIKGCGIGIGVVESPLHMHRDASMEKICEMLGEMVDDSSEVQQQRSIPPLSPTSSKTIEEEGPVVASIPIPPVVDTKAATNDSAKEEKGGKKAILTKPRLPKPIPPTRKEAEDQPTPSPFPSLSCPASPSPTQPAKSVSFLHTGLGVLLLIVCMAYHVYTPTPSTPVILSAPSISQPALSMAKPTSHLPALKTSGVPVSTVSTADITTREGLGDGVGSTGKAGGLSLPTRMPPWLRLLQALRNIFSSPVRLWKRLVSKEGKNKANIVV